MKRFIILCLLFTTGKSWANVDSTGIAGGLPVAVEQQKHSDIDVQVYPNPFVNEINIQSKEADIKRVEIWNMNKKMIFVVPIEIPQGVQFTVAANDYQQGYYLVKIFFEESTKTIMITK